MFELRRLGKRRDVALGHRVWIARELGYRQETAGTQYLDLELLNRSSECRSVTENLLSRSANLCVANC